MNEGITSIMFLFYFDRLSDYALYYLLKKTVPSNFTNSPCLKPASIELNGQTYKKDS